MAEVLFWTISDGDDDIIDVCVRGNDVSLEIPRILDAPVTRNLTPKQARELARDLNAAAREAAKKITGKS